MTILIIDYGSGNLHSVAKSFQRMAEPLGQTVEVSSDPDRVRQASHIVLPGVGAFSDCIAGLKAVDGMIEALEEAVLQQQRPFFGICVGMQMMLERGLEHGEHAGLGWIKGEVVPITVEEGGQEADPLVAEGVRPIAEARRPEQGRPLKIPHMGWNELQLSQPDHPVFSDLPPNPHAYFVHSYHARCADESQVLATVDYGGPISACIGRDNMIGTQFHPEKSQQVGLQLIENFITKY